MTINTLSDEIMLEIFDLCRAESCSGWILVHPKLEWQSLAFVCQRWRRIIFSSPRRLNLQLICTCGTPVKKNLKNLCRWTDFPLNLNIDYSPTLDNKNLTSHDKTNVIAGLRHPDRICSIRLTASKSQLKKIATFMQRPFPELTHLWLSSKCNTLNGMPILPASFLGASAPSLEEIYIENIHFPSLPTLLLSTSNLVVLRLCNIPDLSGLPLDTFVARLAALTKLETLMIHFRSPLRSPAPLTRSVFPALTTFGLRGEWECLDDIVALIDTPRLDDLRVSYIEPLNEPTSQFSKLAQFVTRTADLKTIRFTRAHVDFCDKMVSLNLHHVSAHRLRIRLSCLGIDQVPRLARVLAQSPAVLADVGHLSIGDMELVTLPQLREGMATEWLELLRPFAAVQTLEVSWWSGRLVARAFHRATLNTVAGVLPLPKIVAIHVRPYIRAIMSPDNHPISQRVSDLLLDRYRKLRRSSVLYSHRSSLQILALEDPKKSDGDGRRINAIFPFPLPIIYRLVG